VRSTPETLRTTGLDVLVLGDCNPDLVVHGVDVEPEFGQAERLVDGAGLVIGGSAAITAAGLARLGLRTGLCSVVGDDALGRFMLDALRERGVDVSGCVVDPASPTGLSVVLTRGADRAILTAPGAIAALTARHVPADLLAAARHVHVSPYFLLDGLRPGLPGVLAAAREAGSTTSLDPNFDPAGRWDGGLSAVLPLVDVFLPNETEARRIAGAGAVEDAAAAIAAQGPTVVVKCGAAGALAVRGLGAAGGGAGPLRVGSPQPAGRVLDTIGAGDSFNAGLLAGLLGGLELEQALQLGSACGAASTRARGGTAGQPTLAEARRLALGA